jgi:AcrR family transcriptional regulator
LLQEESEPLSALKIARRDKIVEAAHRQFISAGFRATTMEAIAVAAGMSKVTVYSYFSDKDQVFAAVAARFAARLKSAVMTELERAGSLPERIAAALAAKQAVVYRDVRRSSFSAELFAAKDRAESELFAKLDLDIVDAIGAALVNHGMEAHAAKDLAQLLFAACQGIGIHAGSEVAARRQIDTLVGALVAG